ncbi:MAG: arginyltransferase [Campylobacterales bacterium]
MKNITEPERICEFYPDIRECSYLKDRDAEFRYFHIEGCSNAIYQVLLERGWRRFGMYFFTPICSSCSECITIRYLADEFSPSKNQKRVLKKNQDLEIEVSHPRMTMEHLDLYTRYHIHMNKKKGWDYSPTRPKSYHEMFVEGYEEFGYEIRYRLEGKLVGVSLCDVLPHSISAVYFYYDPDMPKRSLGVFSLLKQLELAKKSNINYLYPGYWIEGHASMGYKERFRPLEVLTNRPDLDEKPVWGRLD